MPSERYFIDTDFAPQQELSLVGSEFHHLAHVMRTRKGDIVALINGRGGLAKGRVIGIGKDKGVIQIEEVEEENRPSCRLVLAQALSKQHRMEFILEKGTELGVDSFWLFPGDHSQKKECYPSQIERATHIIISAAKQCGRLYLPTIILKPPLKEWSDLHQGCSFFGDLDPAAPLFETAWKNQVEGSSSINYPIIFITGPEGGLSNEEESFLKEQHATGVKLHSNILRAETASIMSLSLLSHWCLL